MRRKLWLGKSRDYLARGYRFEDSGNVSEPEETLDQVRNAGDTKFSGGIRTPAAAENSTQFSPLTILEGVSDDQGDKENFFPACLLLLCGCSVGRQHPSDAELELTFKTHETDFEAFRAELSADDKLEMISGNSLRYGGCTVSAGDSLSRVEPLGMTEERLEKYRTHLRQLHLQQVIRHDGLIEFRVDSGSLWNGDSHKGYGYSATPLGNRKLRLDDYRLSPEDKIRFGDFCVYKPIKGNWYLYLFISGS